MVLVARDRETKMTVARVVQDCLKVAFSRSCKLNRQVLVSSLPIRKSLVEETNGVGIEQI